MARFNAGGGQAGVASLIEMMMYSLPGLSDECIETIVKFICRITRLRRY